VQHLEVSPDGAWACLSNERLQVWLVDLNQGQASKMAESEHGAAQGLAWSPDSRWVAYSLPLSRLQSALFLYSVETRTTTQITQPVLADRSPVFDPAGRYLYFVSKRTFKPVHDAVRFDRSFVRADKVYAIALAQETRSPFYAVGRPALGRGDEASTLTEPLAVDLDNIQERVVEFPMKAADIAQLQAAPGRVFWTVRDPEDPPALYGGPKASLTLHQYRFDELKEEQLAQNISSFHLSSDGRVMAVLSGRTLRVVKAGDKWEKKVDEKPGRDSGLVDLSRIAVRVEPEAEWGQMLREAWRLMRALFWTPNMSGIDWDAVYETYAVLVPRLASRSDLSDLLWEMQGELGTSHAYEMNGDYQPNPRQRMGYLGADYRWHEAAQGYEITGLAAGDVWAADQHSPLLDPGVNVAIGDVICAIDGQALSPSMPPGACLVNKGRKDVQLTIKPQGQGESRTVVVRTVDDETPARYRSWVESNRQMVHERTGGQVGYIHIPDMQDPGFAEFHRGFLQELGRQGLIVDVRFNRGGSVSSLLLEELSRRRLGYMVPRYGKPGTYFREGGPLRMVALTNEFAGSDGDIVSHTWKMLGLGPLIGTRTWGGVIGINPQNRLVDGTTTTQPYVALWFYDVEWGVENYGTDPTIEVFNRPQDQARGVDPQMERGLAEILRILEEDPPIEPAFDNRPDLAVRLDD
jgi:tricorn protease